MELLVSYFHFSAFQFISTSEVGFLLSANIEYKIIMFYIDNLEDLCDLIIASFLNIHLYSHNVLAF